MKTSSERKNKNEKVRRENITFFNKAYKFSSNGANVYAIVEYNGKIFIYNSRSDKTWPPSDAMLVSSVAGSLFLHEQDIDSGKENYYPIPERSTPDDIRRRIDRIRERSK